MAMNGIDISKWQKGLKLANIKCDFVIIKATEGATYKDPCFDDFVKDYTTRWEMKASNDKWGAAMQEINGKANLYMNYTAGRQANIRFATEQQLYSAPNELLLRMTPQGDLIEKCIDRINICNLF